MNELKIESRIGLVYEIIGYGLSYVGSTIQALCERKSKHKTGCREWLKRDKLGWKCGSYDILEKGDDWTCEVIEILLTDTNRTGLLEREHYWTETKKALNGKEYITNVNQAIQSVENLKEYQRKWAEKKRREKGITIKEKVKTADNKKYKREKAKEYRANHTDEQRAEINKNRRDSYDNSNQLEYINRPEVKEKRLADQQKKRNAVKMFNLLPFA